MAISPLPNETARLRAVVRASGFRLRLSRHARTEMVNDDIIDADVQWVLDHGTVTWIETKKEEQWHVEGRDVDGRLIRLVVVAYPEEAVVKVITVMELRRPG